MLEDSELVQAFLLFMGIKSPPSQEYDPAFAEQILEVAGLKNAQTGTENTQAQTTTSQQTL